MRIRTCAWIMVAAGTGLPLAGACGDREPVPEQAPPAADTFPAERTASAPGDAGEAPGAAAPTGSAVDRSPSQAIDADSIAGRGDAPQPPGGYAVLSRPASSEQLARVDYATPRSVAQAAEFYDTQVRAARRVELDLAGDNVIVYGLSPSTSVSAATTIHDVERLLEERDEPILVIAPWTIARRDPLVRDLRAIGQNAQADALLATRSKVTVVY
jgi:hypothetical protein